MSFKWLINETREIDNMPLDADTKNLLRLAACFENYRREKGNFTYEELKATAIRLGFSPIVPTNGKG